MRGALDATSGPGPGRFGPLGRGSGLVGLVPVDVGFPGPEPYPAVQAVGGLSGRAGGQLDRPGTSPCGQLDRVTGKGLTDTPAPGGPVDDDILDPGPDPRGDSEDGKGEHPDDLP